MINHCDWKRLRVENRVTSLSTKPWYKETIKKAWEKKRKKKETPQKKKKEKWHKIIKKEKFFGL